MISRQFEALKFFILQFNPIHSHIATYSVTDILYTIFLHMTLYYDIFTYICIYTSFTDIYRPSFLRIVPGRGMHQGKDLGLQELRIFLKLVNDLVPKVLTV